LFTIFQQLNTLMLLQRDMIDPVRSDPFKFIAMEPVLTEQYNDLQFDFPSLSFILSTKHKQILLDLFIEQQRFRETIKVINYRSALHEQVQPIIERTGIEEGVDYPKEALSITLAKALGPRLHKSIESATDQIIFHVDRTIVSIGEIKEKLVKTFKELYPEGDFLNFEMKEVPANKLSEG